MIRRLAILPVLLLTALAVAKPATIPVGGTLADARLDGLNGPPRRLAEFRGRPLIINVWASWCGPCRSEMASLERLAWHDEARRFAIIGVSTDDDRSAALGWLRNSNATISQYIDHDVTLESMLGANRIPLTVLVDARGRIVQKVYGAREWDSSDSLALVRAALANGDAR
jgi:thiol-disulfide isomerase/thioredoxin